MVVRIAIAISNHLKRIGFELRRRDSKLLQLRDQGEDLRPLAWKRFWSADG